MFSHLVAYKLMKPILITINTAIVQILLMPSVFAQDVTANNSLGSYSWEALKVILSLVLVLAIFYLLANIFKKYTGMSIKNNSTMRVLGGLSLGGKDKVVVLQAGDVNLLLGVSASGITKLHQFDKDEVFSSCDQSSFSQQIENIIGNKQS